VASKLKNGKVLWYKSLNTTLLFWFLTISLVPVMIIMYLNSSSAIEKIKEDTFNHLHNTLRLEKKFIQNWFYYREVDASNWSSIEKNVDTKGVAL